MMMVIRYWRALVAAGVVLMMAPSVLAVETGPVQRKWGLGWDDGLTARFWLGGVWEFALSAGPQDFLRDSQGSFYDTGYPPTWNEAEDQTTGEDRTESGYVRAQAGRLVARRGPMAAVVFAGLEYGWSDSRYGNTRIDLDDPDESFNESWDIDSSTWVLSLGFRPSFEVWEFLTIETAFGLEYRWNNSDTVYRSEYPRTGRVVLDISSIEGNSFDDSGWDGMGSLQFIVWF